MSAIPPALDVLWDNVSKVIPGVRLGGIYADKPGYHNTRIANATKWPGNYSIELTADQYGPGDKASAIDLTMGEAEMKRRTEYLRRAALHPDDNRTSYIREFIGTLDGSNVYCLTANGPGTAFRFDGGRDDTHLWHIHISFYRQYCNSTDAMAAVLSVLKGETWEEWSDGDLDAQQAKELKATTARVHAIETLKPTVVSNWSDANPTGTEQVIFVQRFLQLEAKVNDLAARAPATVDVEALATAIVSKLPPDALSAEEVKAACEAAVRAVAADAAS